MKLIAPDAQIRLCDKLLAVSPDDYDYDLPSELIAQRPAPERGDSRMLVVRTGELIEARTSDLCSYLSDALVVVNESKVVPARVWATRDGAERSREFELLICEPAAVSKGAIVQAWVRGARKLRDGDELTVGSLRLRYLANHSAADPRARCFEILEGELMEALLEQGKLPLPPYIQRPEGPSPEDDQRYQTVYASNPGSVAAPTAGLHLTPEQLERVDVAKVTLHVGPGTFLPMEVDDVRKHRVGAERFCVEEAAAEKIRRAKKEKRPVVAVGTTVTRVLESLAKIHNEVVSGAGTTDLVITPGHEFRVVDRLLTNFHLPKSSLLMLTATFGGRERVLEAYRHAVKSKFRFYSFGDCMLLERAPRV